VTTAEGAPESFRSPVGIALVGPTAVGKTALSLDLAERLGAEIVSMDSRQVYRGLDIGTAKATPEERARVPHHGLDLIDPGESYSAGRFARDARRWIESIVARGRVPVLVGGTGFFLRALTRPLFDEPPMEVERREALRAWLGRQPTERLARWVRRLDPERAEVAIEGGPQRMGRALEVVLLTGRPLSHWHREAASERPGLDLLVVVLESPRRRIDRRIARRVETMAEGGLVDEVRGLLESGVSAADPGMTGVGYREIVRHLRGEWSLEEALEAIRVATRQYARRQGTWFRNQMPGRGVLRLEARRPTAELVELVLEAWTRARRCGLEAVQEHASEPATPRDAADGGQQE